MQRTNSILVVCLNAAGLLCAQPSFEVASIKLHPEPISYSADPSVKGNRVVATASTLRDLITSAYHIRYDQLLGGPSWIGSDHYDVEAKVDGGREITMDQMRTMLQALLAERFHLQIHREMREVPMYALVVSKNGPKLKESASTDEPTGRITGNGSGRMHMTVAKGTMAQLALRLSGNGAERPVMDKTGLNGIYTYQLDWLRGMPSGTAGPESDVPSLFVALQEQLGLKLEPTKGSSETIVIDHADKPSAN
jgi:uncharacterized protein (TIGR03435 family)